MDLVAFNVKGWLFVIDLAFPMFGQTELLRSRLEAPPYPSRTTICGTGGFSMHVWTSTKHLGGGTCKRLVL